MEHFFKNNISLTEIRVVQCQLGTEGARQLSLALGNYCNTSLKFIYLSNNQIADGELAGIILALSMHPQLEKLDLGSVNVGRNECTALATLLHNTTKHLQTPNLRGNNIDDEGVEILVHAIDDSQLQVLDLSHNPTITSRGWKTLSTLLELPNSNLKNLDLSHNDLDDEGAFIYANALRENYKLKYLDLSGNGISREGWTPFSKLLCDTSTVNNTYLSNHTLALLTLDLTYNDGLLYDICENLRLNRENEDKGRVAMNKILQDHSHFNVHPFYEWEFKVFPHIINWFAKAKACATEFDEQIKKMKLSCLYDFVNEFPMLYIEPVTRQEIEDCSDMELQLKGDATQMLKLEEVQRRKTRAMRRLL